MARMRKTKNTSRLNVNRRNILLLGMFVVMALIGSSTLFTAFGPSSAWEADVEIVRVSDGVTWYTSEDVTDLGGFPSARIVKVDFDGDPIARHSTIDTIEYPGFLGIFPQGLNHFSRDDLGMQPTVDIAVGQMYLSNEDGVLVTQYWEWEDVDAETGLLRFYFAFSVAFTTRAVQVPHSLPTWILELDTYEYYLRALTEGVPELGEVDVKSNVQLRVGNEGLNYTYKGIVEDVVLLDTRVRYTYNPAEIGVTDESIDVFNSEYDWKEIFEYGSAKPMNEANPISVLHTVIDSESENMAEFSCGAILSAGVDANKRDQFAPTILTGGPETWDIQDISVYNVELIYDLVCEVTLNGIPLTAKGALLTGRYDSVFIPPPDPEPLDWWQEYWWLLLIVGGLFLITGGASKRNRG
jgi:hypothetical protein